MRLFLTVLGFLLLNNNFINSNKIKEKETTLSWNIYNWIFSESTGPEDRGPGSGPGASNVPTFVIRQVRAPHKSRSQVPRTPEVAAAAPRRNSWLPSNPGTIH